MRMVTLKEKFLLNRAKANELSGVKTLNFWGAQLSDVSLLREVPNAEVINASANDIEYLEPFSHCTRLKELYLRKNNIKDIKQVLHLKKLTNLRYLWLSGNPFCEEFTDDEYRLFVLKTLPQLKKLDNITVTAEQLKDADRCGYDVIKGSSYVMSSTSSSSGEMLSPIIPPDDATIDDEVDLDFQPSKLVGDGNNGDDVVKSSQNPDEQDPKLQDSSPQDLSPQDPKLQDPDEQDPVPQDLERSQDPKLQDLDPKDSNEHTQDPDPKDLERSQDPNPKDPKLQDPDPKDPNKQDPNEHSQDPDEQDVERSQDPNPQDPDKQDPDQQDVERCEDTTCSYVRSSLGNKIVEDPNPSSNNVDSTSTKQHQKSSICDSTIDNSSSSCKDDVIEGEANLLVNISPSTQCGDEDATNEVKNIGKFSPTKYDEDVDEKLAANLSLKEEVELSSLISSSCTNLTSPVTQHLPLVVTSTQHHPLVVTPTQHHPLVSAGEPSSSSSICRKVETEDNEILDEMNKIRAEFGSKPLTAEKFYSSNQKNSSRMSSTRKKKKKNNLLTATLALVDELDEENLYLVKEQIEEKLQQISSRNISVMVSSSTSSLDQSIGEISCLDEV